MGCRSKGVTGGRRGLEGDWPWSETKTNPNTKRKWAFGFLLICTSHMAHCTQNMALIKTRHVINCCGSKQCSEVATTTVAVAFSLGDSLLRETHMLGVLNAWSHQTQETSYNFSIIWIFIYLLFIFLFQMKFSVFADLQEWNSTLVPTKLELLLTLFVPRQPFWFNAQFSFIDTSFTPTCLTPSGTAPDLTFRFTLTDAWSQSKAESWSHLQSFLSQSMVWFSAKLFPPVLYVTAFGRGWKVGGKQGWLQ